MAQNGTKGTAEQVNPYAMYEPNAIPTQITRKIFVGYGIGKYNAKTIMISDYDKGGDHGGDFAFVTLLEKEITLDLPNCEVDVKGALLKNLDAEKQKIIAENHMRLKAVQDKIDQLLAIEYHADTTAKAGV